MVVNVLTQAGCGGGLWQNGNAGVGTGKMWLWCNCGEAVGTRIWLWQNGDEGVGTDKMWLWRNGVKDGGTSKM